MASRPRLEDVIRAHACASIRYLSIGDVRVLWIQDPQASSSAEWKY